VRENNLFSPIMAPTQLVFRGKTYEVSETTTQEDIINFLVQLDAQLAGGQIELRLCMVGVQTSVAKVVMLQTAGGTVIRAMGITLDGRRYIVATRKLGAYLSLVLAQHSRRNHVVHCA